MVYAVMYFSFNCNCTTGGYGSFTREDALNRANKENSLIAEGYLSGGGFYYVKEVSGE